MRGFPRFTKLLENPQVALVAVVMNLAVLDGIRHGTAGLVVVQARLVAARCMYAANSRKVESHLVRKHLGELQLPYIPGVSMMRSPFSIGSRMEKLVV